MLLQLNILLSPGFSSTLLCYSVFFLVASVFCIAIFPKSVFIMPTEIPGPPGVPLLGNIFDVNPNETWNSLNKLAKQYGMYRGWEQVS